MRFPDQAMLASRLISMSAFLLMGCARQPSPQPTQDISKPAPTAPASSEPPSSDSADSAPEMPDAPASLAEPSATPPSASSPPASPPSDLDAAPLPEPFVQASLPSSKLRLIDAVEAALRSGDRRAIEALWLDELALRQACPKAPEDEFASQESRRRNGIASFVACVELADWKTARRLALNYGDDIRKYVRGCTSPRALEDSEAYYDVGGRVVKVKVFGPVELGRKYALGRSLRCSAKRGSVAEFEQQIPRFGRRCPGTGWPFLTQTGPSCPRR